MNIVVIVKRIDTSSGANPILDISDKTVLDMAVELRDKHGEQMNHVTALCVAPVEDSVVIRECYALGVNSGYLLADPLFERIDENGVVEIFVHAIKKLPKCDLILMASPSNDEVTIGVGNKIANALNFNHAKFVQDFDLVKNKILIKNSFNSRGLPEKEKILDTPTLINVICDSNDKVHNAMRLMKVFKKEVNILNSYDINIDSKKLKINSKV